MVSRMTTTNYIQIKSSPIRSFITSEIVRVAYAKQKIERTNDQWKKNDEYSTHCERRYYDGYSPRSLHLSLSHNDYHFFFHLSSFSLHLQASWESWRPGPGPWPLGPGKYGHKISNPRSQGPNKKSPLKTVFYMSTNCGQNFVGNSTSSAKFTKLRKRSHNNRRQFIVSSSRISPSPTIRNNSEHLNLILSPITILIYVSIL